MGEHSVTNFDNLIIQPAEGTTDYSNNQKYIRIGESNIASRISGLTQFSTEAVDNAIVKNAYIVTFPEGISGVLRQAKDGSGLIPIIADENTGKYLKQARLHDLKDLAIFSSAMTGLSIITSQYYLKQINQKLAVIQSKLDKVLDFLYTDKICEIYAEAQLVYGIYSNFESIVSNDDLRIASITTVQHARGIAEKNIQFYYRDMNKIAVVSDAKTQSRQERIAMNIRDDLNGYNQSVSLFGLCCFLEVVLSQNYERSYLTYMSDLVSSHSSNHDIVISRIQGKLDSIAESAGGLLSKKASPDLIELIDLIHTTVGEDSPIKEFEEILEIFSDDVTSRSEYVVLDDGSVYKKRIA